jgi:choline dehydrogenase-like flavoprotein
MWGKDPVQITAVQITMLMSSDQYDKNLDLNSGNPIGFGMSPTTVYNGLRNTSSSAYLQDVPPNLMITTSLEVVKILFENEKATGVVLSDGTSSKTLMLNAFCYEITT